MHDFWCELIKKSMKFLFLLFFLPFLSLAQLNLATGSVIPKITLEEGSDKTYALYLPRTYDETKEYPTIFVFDALGRGASVVQQFTIGANLTESIVIGANYILNDSLKIAFKQTETLINTSFDLYAIDKEKIILAGNSNAALVISSSAQLSNSIYGIIAVNDVFLDKKLLRKNPNLKISLLSSDEDGRFYKMRSYTQDYRYEKFITDYHVYGSSDWPAAGYLATSLTGLLLENDTSLEKVQSYYDSDLAFGGLLFKRQQHLYAFEFVSSLKKKYKKRLDINSQKDLLKKIRSNGSFRSKRTQSTLINYSEDLLVEDFQYYLQEDTKNAYFDNLGWWGSQMDDLDAKIDTTYTVPLITKSALRLRGYVQYEVEQQYGVIQAEQGKLEKSLFVNVLRTLVNPKNEDAFIQVITLSAKEEDYNAAYFYLEELLKLGYTDYEELYKIPYTKAIVIGAEWNEIIKEYLGKSKYY